MKQRSIKTWSAISQVTVSRIRNKDGWLSLRARVVVFQNEIDRSQHRETYKKRV